MDDDGLARKSQEGDRGAFAKLYDRYSAKIYAYHYYRTFSRESAEDLCSQTFLKALEGLGGYQSGKGRFIAWLYGIARNCLVDCVRERARTVSLDAHEVLADGWSLDERDGFEHDVAERDRWERLKPHLASLDSGARELLILRVWDGLSHAQIAAITGRTEAACKMGYSRALESLRKAMPLSLYVAFLASPPPCGGGGRRGA